MAAAIPSIPQSSLLFSKLGVSSGEFVNIVGRFVPVNDNRKDVIRGSIL